MFCSMFLFAPKDIFNLMSETNCTHDQELTLDNMLKKLSYLLVLAVLNLVGITECFVQISQIGSSFDLYHCTILAQQHQQTTKKEEKYLYVG